MADPMKVRATLKGDTGEIRVLMNHPMETGQRKDGSGKIVPLHFIQNVEVKVNGRSVVEGQISQAVSRNPVFSFRVKGAKAGDKVEVSWLDNKGDTNKTETALA
jgi:sulfur-oxidizing protein SoxZ